MFLKNKNIIFKIRRSKVTDYAALNSEVTLSSGNWTSWTKTNQATKKGLFRDMTVTFHRMLKFNFLYNTMVNYTFPSYEYILLTKYKLGHHVS